MALTTLLGLWLPGQTETLLLRACLQPGPHARDAFAQWSQITGGSVEVLAGGRLRRLSPLLHASVNANGLSVPVQLRRALRAAALHEDLRACTLAEVVCVVIDRIARAGVPSLLTRGVALSAGAYASPGLRHCHDLDLLVRDDQRQAAGNALLAAGFTRLAEPGPPSFLHASGLPVRLHRDLFQVPGYMPPLAGLFQRAVDAPAYGPAARALSPADLLVHVIVHAATGEHRNSLVWVCDAWHAVAANPSFPWDGVLDLARENQLAVPLALGLGYLSNELGLAVPPAVLDALGSTSMSVLDAGPIAAHVALDGVRRGMPGGALGLLYHAGGWQMRMAAGRAVLLPPAGALQALGRIESSQSLLTYHASRPMRFMSRRLAAWQQRVRDARKRDARR